MKRNGEIIGDVDVGFMKADCLCLIECKDVAPYPSLLLDKEKEVLRKVQRYVNKSPFRHMIA